MRRKAKAIVDEHAEKGEGDFVQLFASPLPLQIICEMMGIERDQWNTVFEATNTILGIGDPEYVTDMGQLMAAAMSLYQMAIDLGEHRLANPKDDLTTALMHAEVDGEHLTTQELGSFFILLVAAGNETTRNSISHGMKLLTDHPDAARALARRLQRPRAWRRRGDRALRNARDPLPAHRDPRHRARRREDRRGREGGALVHVGEP